MKLARGLSACLVAAVLATTPAATASGGGAEVRKTGKCSMSSTWKLKLKKDDGRIETEFEVDQNVVGDTWRVTLKHNGNRFFRDRRTTKAPSGSFEVNKSVNDAAGKDTISARARNLSTDELCKAQASI